MIFTEEQTLTFQSSGSRRLYSPLAISLLYWPPVESGLFWGWHGKQLLPQLLHPSPESSSARHGIKRKKKRVDVCAVVFFPLLTTLRAASLLPAALKAQDGLLGIHIPIRAYKTHCNRQGWDCLGPQPFPVVSGSSDFSSSVIFPRLATYLKSFFFQVFFLHKETVV